MMGWGGGGMLPFLVHRTLYVATLQWSLVLLLRFMLLRCSWWGGVGGGMLPFLVLRTLYVATLQRSLVLLLRFMLLRCRDLWCCCYIICCYAWIDLWCCCYVKCCYAWINIWCCCYVTCCYAAHDGVGLGGHVSVPCVSCVICCLPRQGEDQLPHWNNWCCMGCCQRLHSQFIVFKEQRCSPVCQMLAMSICECTYSPPAKDHFDAETLAVKGEEKVSDQKCQKPWRNASLAKFSSENLAKFNVRFAVAKTTLKKKTCVLRARFPVRRHLYVQISIWQKIAVIFNIFGHKHVNITAKRSSLAKKKAPHLGSIGFL